jgi:hypothetical protein
VIARNIWDANGAAATVLDPLAFKAVRYALAVLLALAALVLSLYRLRPIPAVSPNYGSRG